MFMKCIKCDSSYEICIKGSKFIGFSYRVWNGDDVAKRISEVKERFKGATHYCYGYVINGYIKCSDDGEPSGTAGAPVLNVIKGQELNFVLIIVVRYFGGTLLGAGGLVRAYSECAKGAILEAEIGEIVSGKRIEIVFDYDKSDYINYMFKESEIVSKDFGERVRYVVRVNMDLYDKVKVMNGVRIVSEEDIYI